MFIETDKPDRYLEVKNKHPNHSNIPKRKVINLKEKVVTRL